MKHFPIFIIIALFTLMIPVIKAEEGWMTSLEKAKVEAQKTNRHILINFSGSDWCYWCKKLDREVFSTSKWKKEAPKHYVLLLIDSPSKRVKMDPKQRAYNRSLVKKFSIRGYPSVYLLDSNGKPYAITGYRRGGPDFYLKHLKAFREGKTKLETLLKKIEGKSKEEQAKVLDQVCSIAQKKQMGNFYIAEQKKIIQLDLENKLGLKAKYALALYQYFTQKRNPLAKQYFEIIKKYAPEKVKAIEFDGKLKKIFMTYGRRGNWKEARKAVFALIKANSPKGENELKAYYTLAIIEYRLHNLPKTIEYLEKAVKADPTNKMAKQLKVIISRLKTKNK